MNSKITVRRVYEPETDQDGARILVDRLWPRGESKVRADLEEWDKEIAPSSPLRKAFHDREIPFDEFAKRYLKELEENPKAADFTDHVKDLLEKGNVTLLYASKNQDQNNAVVLKGWLENRLKSQPVHPEQQKK